MDVQGAGGNERMLRRVIALLVAFAALAERVAGRSAWVCSFMIWILRRAETAAADFLFEEAGIPPAMDGMAAAGNGPDAALRLAARFRALAALLRALLPLDNPFGRRPARRGFAFGNGARTSGRGSGAWTRPPFDTS